MRVAVCLSGLMRNFEVTQPQLETHLISPLKKEGHQVDIFIHTWNVLDRHLGFINEQLIISKYNPLDMQVEMLYVPNLNISKLSYDKNILNKREVEGIYSMYYKIKSCNDLKTKYEQLNNFKYDIVIRLRPDILLKEKFAINSNLLEKISIPKYGNYFGINDQIAYSNSEQMDIYSSTFEYLNDYIQDMNMTDPELFLQYHILYHGLKINRFDLDYLLCSHNSQIDQKENEKKWIYDMRKLG